MKLAFVLRNQEFNNACNNLVTVTFYVTCLTIFLLKHYLFLKEHGK